MNWYHSLVQNGLWRDVLSWAVVAVLSALSAMVPWRRSARRQRHIEDLLDTDKPGGLTPLLHALQAMHSQQHQVGQQSAHEGGGHDHGNNPGP